MIPARLRSGLLPALFFALATVVICGCGVPVAPGYQIQKESLSVHFVPGNPPHLAIRADYRLANIGNSPLRLIPLILPGEKDFGLANLGAQVDGKDVAPQHNPHEVAEDWRIPLASPWQQKQKINLTLSYDLAALTPADPRIFVATNMFYLNDSGWFPAFMGFKAFLSPPVTRPNSIDVSVTVPSDFRATASGQPREQKHSGETEYRFRIGRSDFNPYVLAGQYQQQIVSSAGVTVIFWAFDNVDVRQLHAAATSISDTRKFLDKTFHAADSTKPFTIAILPNDDQNALPDFVLFPAGLITQDFYLHQLRDAKAASQALDTVRALLADRLVNTTITPRPDAWLMRGALSVYIEELVDESQGPGSSRSVTVSRLLHDYDRESENAVAPSPLSVPQDSSQMQQRMALDQAKLFLFALEDKCGQQNVTHAIAHMVYALRGGEYGYPEFRSALEEQCHQDLAEFFRTWLAQPGIPPDFRARYGGSSGPK